MADMPNNSILNKILTSIENEFDFFARVTTNFLQKSACSAEPGKNHQSEVKKLTHFVPQSQFIILGSLKSFLPFDHQNHESCIPTNWRPSQIGQGGDEVLHLLGQPPLLQLLQLHQHQALPVVLRAAV